MGSASTEIKQVVLLQKSARFKRGREFAYASEPPSTTIAWPVIHDAAFEAR